MEMMIMGTLERRRLFPVTATLALAALVCAPAAVLAEASNKWRLEVSGNAESAGTILLEVRPVGGAATQVAVPVARGTSENDVAQAIANALQGKLNTQSITVEVDDSEDVLLKATDGAGDFDVTVVSSDVKDLKINLDKE